MVESAIAGCQEHDLQRTEAEITGFSAKVGQRSNTTMVKLRP
ncbi:hypothetical protein [Nostoc sp.]